MARAKHYVGIDIGTTRVKLCQLKRTKEQLALDQYGTVSLAPTTIVDGSIYKPAAIVEALKELKDTRKIRNKRAAISVSGHAVIVKKISLPQMSQEELEQSIQWEAEQFIPFDIADVNIDVQVINEHSAQQGQMDVVLVAAKKDFIQEYTSVIAEAGFEPMVCDVDVFAIETMFAANYDLPLNGTLALINVGAAQTNINIVSGGVSTFTRDLWVGGNNFTEEVQKQLNVSYDEAEALKLGGNPADDTASDTVVPQEVHGALQTVADQVATEIQRSLDFYSATSADPPPSQIYLMGGAAQLRILEEAINSRIGVSISAVNPFRRIATTNHDPSYLASQASAAAVAVGLALRYPGDA